MRYKEYQKNKVKKQSGVDVDPLWGIWCWCWCWYRHIILPPYIGSTKCVMSKPLSKEIQKKKHHPLGIFLNALSSSIHGRNLYYTSSMRCFDYTK